LLAIKRDGFWGYVNEEGETVIDFAFRDASAFVRGVALIMTEAEGINIIDHDGNLLLEEDYVDIHRDLDDKVMIYYVPEQGFGLMAEDDDLITGPDYADIFGEFEEGLLPVAVADGGPYGYIDVNGNLAIDAIYEQTYSFSAGLGIVYDNERFGLIDHEGDYVIEPIYRDVWAFDPYSRAIVQNEDYTYSLIDNSGTVLIDSVVDIWGEGPLYEVELANGNYRLYDVDGDFFTEREYTYTYCYGGYVFDLEWDEGFDHYDEIILFNENGTIDYNVDYWESDVVYGPYDKPYIIDYTNGVVIHTYDYEVSIAASYVEMITNTLIVVNDGTHVGAFSLTAVPSIVIPFDYYTLTPLADDYAVAENDEGIGVINLNNEVVVPFVNSNFNILPNLIYGV